VTRLRGKTFKTLEVLVCQGGCTEDELDVRMQRWKRPKHTNHGADFNTASRCFI